MAKLKKQIAIVFLGVFILIKVSPAYYRDQFLPQRSTGGSNLSSISFRASQHANFLISIQKGIVDNDTFKAIPKIKFSGVLFAMLFLGTYLISLSTSQNFSSFKYTRGETKKYILQGILRL